MANNVNNLAKTISKGDKLQVGACLGGKKEHFSSMFKQKFLYKLWPNNNKSNIGIQKKMYLKLFLAKATKQK